MLPDVGELVGLRVGKRVGAAKKHIENKYNISSLLDAPCGGMAWQPLVLHDIMLYNPLFLY